MRNVILSILLSLFSAQCAVSQEVNQRITNSDGSEQLVGLLTEQGLSSPPFNNWYEKAVDLYEPNREVLKSISDLQDYEIQVFMGTWCGDSRREVPRLMKTLHELNFPDEQLAIVGVNRTKDQYKQSPDGEEAGKNIHRVPTIIFYKNGKEVNRIVESPVASLEQDIQTITSGGEYISNYLIVAKLAKLLESKDASIVFDEAEFIAHELKPISINPSELTTYGYVQLYQKHNAQAVAIFEVNRLLFPNEAIVYESLAAAYYDQGSYDKAEDNAEKALRLDPGSESALETLAKIASK